MEKHVYLLEVQWPGEPPQFAGVYRSWESLSGHFWGETRDLPERVVGHVVRSLPPPLKDHRELVRWPDGSVFSATFPVRSWADHGDCVQMHVRQVDLL